MIPTIETICEDLKAGKITVGQAISWLHQHAEGSSNERRDMFAAMAMQGYCSNIGTTQHARLVADWSWEMADAMLASQLGGDMEGGK